MLEAVLRAQSVLLFIILITRHLLTYHWLWRWLLHKLSKRQSQPITDILRTTPTRTTNKPQTLPQPASDLSNYFKLNTLFIETFKNTWHFACTRHYIYTNLHVLYGNFLPQSIFIVQHLTTTTTTTTTTAIVFAFPSIKYIYNIKDMVLYFIFPYMLKSKEAGRENIALQRRRSPGFQWTARFSC